MERLTFLFSLFSDDVLTVANNNSTETTSPVVQPTYEVIYADILSFLNLIVGREIPNNLNFFDFANDFIDESVLTSTLEKFSLLPHIDEEVSLVSKGNDITMSPNSSVFILSSFWLVDWISYTRARVEFDDSGVLVTSVLPSSDPVLKRNARRPDEIDNSKLVVSSVGKSELAPGLSGSLNKDYVAVNSVVWSAFSLLYGGGPVLERKIKSSSSSLNDINLFPFIISIYTLNPSTERPELLHSAAMTYFEISLGSIIQEMSILSSSSDYRVWILLEESESIPFLTLADAAEAENESEFDQQTSKGLVFFKYGLSSRFVLIPKKLHNSTLNDCSLISGSRILFEFSSDASHWSTDRYIEPADFRKFSNGDLVDAMTMEGKWERGIIVDVTEVKYGFYRDMASSSSSASTTDPEGSMNTKTDLRLKIHFDGQNPKFDEYYDSMSNKVAPRGAFTEEPEEVVVVVANADGTTATIDTTAANANDDTKKISYQPSFINMAVKFIKSVVTGTNIRDNDDDSQSGVSLVRHGGRRRNRRRRGRFVAQSDDGNDEPIKIVPGIVGLVNLGNTCYMNCALQCLNHTPLLRAYMLSSRYESDLNRDNPLGTQGRLTQEFAALLQQLWSDQQEYVNPIRFKRALDRFKEQFVGHDQHDSQELVAELLDSLHEDVNKVLVKPYTPQPEDDVWDAMTIEEQAQDSWERYLMRNQSVLVDLFQGQMKTEVQCPTCGRVSRTFDPFMYLSVPVPDQHEKTIIVSFMDRIKSDHFDQLLASSEEKGSSNDPDRDWKTSVTPIRIAVTLPRLSEIFVLKEEIAKAMKHSFQASQIQLLELYRGRIIRFIDDRLTLSCIRNSEHIAAMIHPIRPGSIENRVSLFERIYKCIASNETIEASDGKHDEYWSCLFPKQQVESNGKAGATDVDEHGIPLPAAITTTATRMVNWNEYSDYDSDYDCDVTTFVQLKRQKVNESNVFSRINEIKPYEWTRIIQSLFLRNEPPIRDEDDVDESDTRMANLNRIDELSAESLMERFKIQCSDPLVWPPEKPSDLIGMRVDGLDSKKMWYAGTVVYLSKTKGYRVHFDNYSNRWDEWFPASIVHTATRTKSCLQPVFTKTVCKMRSAEIQVMMRRNLIVPISTFNLASPPTQTNVLRKEITGLPFMISVESFRSCKYTKEVIARQAMRFLNAATCRRILLEACSNKRKFDRQIWIHKVKSLPFQVRVVSGMNILIVHESEANAVLGKVETETKKTNDDDDDAYLTWEGEEFCDSDSRPFCNYNHPRLAVTVDWTDMTNFDEDVCNKFATHESLAVLMEEMKLMGNNGMGLGDITLGDCLSSFTREEAVEDWYCSKCKGPKMGKMKCELWRTPDILVIHLKRFNVSGRHREKLFTRIVFPTNSLSVAQYVSASSRIGEEADDMKHVYDLYSVSNHLGGLSGGHYTAFCRVVPCGADGVEEVAISSCDSAASSRWVHFDDEFVEDVTQDRLVTEAAYLLFYRRRRLSPANVINMAV